MVDNVRGLSLIPLSTVLSVFWMSQRKDKVTGVSAWFIKGVSTGYTKYIMLAPVL